MKTWKTNLEETKQRYINWWNHKGIILSMWEHFQEGVKPHADIAPPAPARDLSQKWFDPQRRAEYLDWYVAHCSLMADMLPVAYTQLGPGSLAAILGGVFEGGEDTIWIHPDPNFNDEIVFNPEHPNWLLHKELLKACKAKANGNYFVGMPDLMEGLDVLAALIGTDMVLLDTVMQPEVLEQQMQQINDIYFKVFDELYDIIREGDEMAFCYFSSWAPGKMSKLQSDISTMISQDDYRRFVQPFIREQCQKIDYTLYHLDGVGAMHHLPALLEIEELNAIQWTPGVGEPQGGSPKWYDLYKKILAGGKSVMACWVTLEELKPLLDHIGADGVHLEMDFHNEREVEQAMRIIEEYTGSSSSVSADVHTNQPVGEQDNAQESIRIREEKSQEEDRLKPLYDAIVAGKLELHSASQPKIDTGNCIGCNICVKHCAHDAVHLNAGRKAEIDYAKCVGCGQCVALCQYDGAIMGDEDTSERLNYKIAEYSLAVVKDKPNFHISFIMNVSPECDCWNHNDAAIVPDLGILASTDLVALDKACADMVIQAPILHTGNRLSAGHEHDDLCGHDKFHMMHPDTDWLAGLRHAEKIGLGNMQYELVKI